MSAVQDIYLHEFLDVDGEALLVEAGFGESVSENDVATSDGFLLGLFHATLSRGVTAEKGIIKLAWDVGDWLTLDLEDNFVNDLKFTSETGFTPQFWQVVKLKPDRQKLYESAKAAKIFQVFQRESLIWLSGKHDKNRLHESFCNLWNDYP